MFSSVQSVVHTEENKSYSYHYIYPNPEEFKTAEENEALRVELSKQKGAWFIQAKREDDLSIIYRITSHPKTKYLCLIRHNEDNPEDPVLWFEEGYTEFEFQFFMLLNKAFQQIGAVSVNFFKGRG